MIGRLRFRLSGYSRPGFDADRLCDACGLAWAYGAWFPRWCKECRSRAAAYDVSSTPSPAASGEKRRDPQ